MRSLSLLSAVVKFLTQMFFFVDESSMNVFRKHFLFFRQKLNSRFKDRFIHFDRRNKLMKMNEAYFTHLTDEGKIGISFRYIYNVDDNKKVDRVFNFLRDLNESVDISLDRIKSNIEKEVTKKMRQKKKKQSAEAKPEEKKEIPQISVELHNSQGIINNRNFTDLLDHFATDEHLLNIQQSNIQINYTVKFNWPSINLLSLPTAFLAGFYAYPTKLEVTHTDRQASEFIWFRGKLPSNQIEEQIDWEEIGRGFSLLVRHEDIGYKLKLKAVPKSIDGIKIGPAVETIGKNSVEAGPGSCPFEFRHLFTMDRLSGSTIRVASYNLLADYYADSEDGRTKLFNYCPEYAIKIDYRKQLLLKEILGYNADIFCFQEVDFKVFDGDMIPFLRQQDMVGVHNKKGTTPEGVAMFYRSDRFELLEHHGLNIGDSIKTREACQELYQKLKGNEKLLERLTDLATTLQVVILKSKDFPEKYITVANTHLYFHPDSDHIRLLQIGFSMILVEDIIKKFKESSKSQDVSLIFCGDFNSVPECGICKLMTENFVPEDYIDWRSNEEQAVKNVSLSQPFKMKSACGFPRFTNYTVGFQECLDYIFYQTDKFSVTKIVETPDEDDLKAHIAIPSVVFPSDHIAIIAELEIL